MSVSGPDRGRIYEIPSATMPGGHTPEVLLDRFVRFSAWCADLGIRTSGTRISRYQHYLEKSQRWRDELDRGNFLDPLDSQIGTGIGRYLYVLREVHELTWISEGLRDTQAPGISKKLNDIVSGSDFAALDRNNNSRNTQFELRIASYLARAGFSINLDTLTDIVATSGNLTYHVECKRVSSPKQLGRRIREATEQLRLRIPKNSRSHQHASLVAADVTKVAFPHNGITRAITPEHSREVIQEKLVSIGLTLRFTEDLNITSACFLWLQIHIPSLILIPATPATRFSNYFMENKHASTYIEEQANAFWETFKNIKTTEHDDMPPQNLTLRGGVHIPEDTLVAPDVDLLSHLSSARELPTLADEHVVLSVLAPGGSDDDWLDFSFFELKLIFNALSPEDRDQCSSPETGMMALAARLLLLRYPYQGTPSWLDLEDPPETSRAPK